MLSANNKGMTKIKICSKVPAKECIFFLICGRSFPNNGKGWDIRICVC
jgi:hypothetical protein